jgi:hypothetical protein
MRVPCANLDAQLGISWQVLDDLVNVLTVLAEIEADLGRLLDRVVVAALGLALARNTFSFRPTSGEPKVLHASAYRATNRSVRCAASVATSGSMNYYSAARHIAVRHIVRTARGRAVRRFDDLYSCIAHNGMTARPFRSQTRPSQTGSAGLTRLARRKINLRGPRPGP